MYELKFDENVATCKKKNRTNLREAFSADNRETFHCLMEKHMAESTTTERGKVACLLVRGEISRLAAKCTLGK